MRYRPFGTSGAAVSCISLALTDQPMRTEERIKLIYAALEAGINTFDLQTRDPAIVTALGEAISSVDRRMVFVSAHFGWHTDGGKSARDLTPEGLTYAIAEVVERAGLERLDVACIDTRKDEPMPADIVPTLQAAQDARLIRMVGVAGGEAVDPYLDTGAFQALSTQFSIQSGWVERNRLKRATQADMAIMGYGFQPFAPPVEEALDKPSNALAGIGRLLGGGDKKQRPPGPYLFLDRTPGWTAEEICLGYALTEPALTTVLVHARTAEQIHKLAAVAERDLPTGVSAQIEMARFSGGKVSGVA